MEKIKVLLVDDDPDLISAVEAILTHKGYHVFVAYNKEEALEQLEKEKPDIAIFDVMMEQEHDGFELARQSKKMRPEMPVIMLTAISDVTGVNFRSAVSDSDWLPADEYLDKPVVPNELFDCIEELVTKKVE